MIYTAGELKLLLKEHDIRIKKRLGQNFLIDNNQVKRIITASDVNNEDLVLEIGPGLGALTDELSLACKKFVAIEFDRDLYSLLKEHFSGYKNTEIIHGDILKYKFEAKSKVIGNLPYYITSPIIAYLIDNRKYIDTAYLTIQKEVAERLVARPGIKSYGSLSCFVQFYCVPKILFSISKKAFYPRPAVESCLVKLEFLKEPAVEVTDEDLFFKIIKAVFGQRRKILLNALLGSNMFNIEKSKFNNILLSLKINPKRRGETLSLQEFANIQEKVSQL